MNVKKTIIFFSVFVILAVVVLLVEKPFKEPTAKSDEDIQKLFPMFSSERANSIEIKQIPEQVFQLKRVDQGWVVENQNNFPADPVEVEDALKKIPEFDNTQLVSNNPDNQGKFQVNKLGIEVIIKDSTNKDLAHFFVGKNGPDYTSTYIRSEGSDNVYLVKGYLKSIFDKSKTKWRDANILAFEKDTVDSIQMHFVKEEEGKQTEHDLTIQSAMEEEKTVWNIIQPEPFPAKVSEMTRIVNSLATFKADDFAIEKTPADTGLEEPKQWITVTMKDGMNYKLEVGSKDDRNRFFIKNRDKEYIYLINEYKFNNICKTYDELKDEEKKKADEEKQRQAEQTEENQGKSDQIEIKTGQLETTNALENKRDTKTEVKSEVK